MAKKKKTPQKGNKAKQKQSNDAWISMRSGLITITILSLGMAGLTGYQTIPALGWFEGLLWSLGFGAAVWLVFVGFLYFNRFVRKKKE